MRSCQAELHAGGWGGAGSVNGVFPSLGSLLLHRQDAWCCSEQPVGAAVVFPSFRLPGQEVWLTIKGKKKGTYGLT